MLVLIIERVARQRDQVRLKLLHLRFRSLSFPLSSACRGVTIPAWPLTAVNQHTSI